MKMYRSMWLIAMLVVSTAFVACSKDDGGDPDDPGSKVPDPEGTMVLNMRNENNGGTYLRMENWPEIWINHSDNFESYADRIEFVSLGKMKGLGNVTKIPETGWESSVAVKPAYGYVAKWGNRYCRLYVVQELLAAGTNGVIGAEVKYQYPFEPTKLEVSPDSLHFPPEGGSQTVTITTDAQSWRLCGQPSWCVITPNGNKLDITVSPNAGETFQYGIVSVCAGEKTVHVKVKQDVAYLNIQSQPLSFSAQGGSETITVESNVDWTVSATKDWCEVAKEGDRFTVRVGAFQGNTLQRRDTVVVSASTGYRVKLAVFQEGNETSAPYAVGDPYNENGVKGIVYKVTEGGMHGMIVSLDETECVWSTESVVTGATDPNNGQINTDRVKALYSAAWWEANGESYYPAFWWCDVKNGGEGSGWYLPADEELVALYTAFCGLETYPGWEDTADRKYLEERKAFNVIFVNNGGMVLREDSYWTSHEYQYYGSSRQAARVNFKNGFIDANHNKGSENYVRAVRPF